MPRFFRRLAMGVFDVEDLKFRTLELAHFVRAAGKEHDLRGPVIAVGYSNGANIAASLLLLEPDLLQGAALLHAMVPFEPETMPDLSSVPVLLTGGERDPMIPLEQTRTLARILDEAKADVVLDVQPGGHELTQAEVDKATEWFGSLEDVA
jgi:predicted esterase